MKLQQFKRLIKEDVAEKDRPLMEKLAYALNPFCDDVTNALNNNLSIEDNLNQKKKSITVVVDGSGIPTQTLQLATNLASNCYGIVVVKAINSTTPTSFVTGYPFISFSEANKIITINNITGLTAGPTYVLSLILYA